MLRKWLEGNIIRIPKYECWLLLDGLRWVTFFFSHFYFIVCILYCVYIFHSVKNSTISKTFYCSRTGWDKVDDSLSDLCWAPTCCVSSMGLGIGVTKWDSVLDLRLLQAHEEGQVTWKKVLGIFCCSWVRREPWVGWGF